MLSSVVTYKVSIRLPVFFVYLMEISSMQKNLPRIFDGNIFDSEKVGSS
jgi:hypothetical protein